MIRNQIEAVVGQLVVNAAFLYGTSKELNNLLDQNIQWPVVLLYNLKPAELSTTLSNAINAKYSLYMEFLYKTTFDQNTSQNENNLVLAESMANEFLVKLQNYRESADAPRYFKIHQKEKIKMVPVYNKKDVNSTGVSISFTLNTMTNQGYDPNSRPA